MPRPIPEHGEPVNGDSFLDIVASVVSIMIIMVVMEGMRIKNMPVTASMSAGPASKALERELAGEQSLRGDILKMTSEIRGLQRETAVRGGQRDFLATMASAAEHEFQARREKLDTARQTDFDTTRNLSESRFQLEQLERQREQVEQQPGRSRS